MNKKYTFAQFLFILCDCQGWSQAEAVESFEDYNGLLWQVVDDCFPGADFDEFTNALV